jgi:putative flippase GtrA
MQFLLYLIVGGVSFLVEIATFIALRRAAMPVIPASVTSFIVATVANYLLSIVLAFQRGRFRRPVELARFLGVVLVGLGLNTALVWIFVYPLAIPPTLAKISVVPIVLVWNYLGRRMLVFDARIPIPIPSWLLSVSRDDFELACFEQPSSGVGEGLETESIRSRSAR